MHIIVAFAFILAFTRFVWAPGWQLITQSAYEIVTAGDYVGIWLAEDKCAP